VPLRHGGEKNAAESPGRRDFPATQRFRGKKIKWLINSYVECPLFTLFLFHHDKPVIQQQPDNGQHADHGKGDP
jgi:hypothetical protein